MSSSSPPSSSSSVSTSADFTYDSRSSSLSKLNASLLTQDVKLRWPLIAFASLPLLLCHSGIAIRPILYSCALHALCAGAQWLADRIAVVLILPVSNAAGAALADTASLARRGGKMGEGIVKALSEVTVFLATRRAAVDLLREKILCATNIRAIHLRTPDGVSLEGFLTSPHHDPVALAAKRILIYVGGNAEHAEEATLAFEAEWVRRRGFYLFTINVRGMGRSGRGSTGSSGAVVTQHRPTRRGLIIDTATAIAFTTAPIAQGGFGAEMPPAVIGHSLGGALSFIALAAICMPADCVNDRSFSRLSMVADSHIAGIVQTAFSPPRTESEISTEKAKKNLSKFAATLLAFAIKHVALWELDGASAWDALPSGTRKLALAAPEDEVIPVSAQLAAVLGKGEASLQCARTPKGTSAHNRGWSREEVEWVAQVFKR